MIYMHKRPINQSKGKAELNDATNFMNHGLISIKLIIYNADRNYIAK